MQISRLDKFVVPLTGQEIELQQVHYAGGGMPQLRVRIRERTRFTTVDVDPITAARWGGALTAWARAQPGVDAGAASEPVRRDTGTGAADRSDG